MSRGSLETLLELRNRKKEAAAKEVAKWRAMGAQLDGIAASIQQQLNGVGAPISDPALFQLQQDASQRWRQQLGEVLARRKDAGLHELKATQEHQKAMRDAKAIERLVEKRALEERTAAERKEQQEMEDLFLMAHAHGPKKDADGR